MPHFELSPLSPNLGGISLVGFMLSEWSLKLGLVNLLPFPKCDGTKTIGLITASLYSPEKADLVIKWIHRLMIFLIVILLGVAVWRDLEHLRVF